MGSVLLTQTEDKCKSISYTSSRNGSFNSRLFFWQVLLAVIFIIFMIQTVFIEAGSIENRTFGNSSLSGLTSAFNTSKFSCNNHTDCEGHRLFKYCRTVMGYSYCSLL